MKTARPSFREELLPCLVELDIEAGVFVGHCLQYDLVSTGPTMESAWENLKELIRHHVQYCTVYYPEGLKQRAPREDWVRWNELAREAPHEHPTERIHIEIPDSVGPRSWLLKRRLDEHASPDLVQRVH